MKKSQSVRAKLERFSWHDEAPTEASGWGLEATRDLEFVFCLVRSTDIDELRRINSAIAHLASDRNGIVHHNAFLTWIAFGMPSVEPDSRDRRLACVGDIGEELINDVSLIHGSRECKVGNTGSDSVCSYGFTFDDYHECLRTLFELRLGEAREV